MTVRGQTVQGGRVPLRKAPLPSRMYPWSTKRPCGPLAFRRATEGSRVLRRVWGSQEGAREPYGALAPFCPGRWAPASPPPDGGTPRPPKAATVHAHFERKVASSGAPLYRREVNRQQMEKIFRMPSGSYRCFDRSSRYSSSAPGLPTTASDACAGSKIRRASSRISSRVTLS